MKFSPKPFTFFLKRIAVLFIILFPLNALAQVTFDHKKGSYTDHTLHFHWQLPKELKWEFTDGIEMHTVFRATSPYGVTTTINLRRVEGWDNPNIDKTLATERFYNLGYQKSAASKILESLNYRNGCTYKIINIKECTFAGHRAIKEISYFTFHDDARYEKNYHVSYRILKDGAIWQISATIDDQLWKELDSATVNSLFKGFYFLSTQKRN